MSFSPYQSNSESFKKLNPHLFPGYGGNPTAGSEPVREARPAVVEPDVRHEPVGEVPGAKARATRFSLRVTIYRQRLVDPENVVTKHVAGDCLQMCGLLRNDDAATIDLTVSQKKVSSPQEEGTLIQLIPIYE